MAPHHMLKFKIITSCTLGTFLEFFDYTLYGFFASTIGHLFFPNETPTWQLIATWAIFSIGFLVRPLGATLFGSIADKKGRKAILPFTILLMAIPTISIGLLPTFETIGWFAPLLLLLCRIIQGIAISAEYNGASIYILENKWSRAGLLGALTPFSCGMGMLAAACVASFYQEIIGNNELSTWQWRIPFIIAGLLVGFTAWYLRSTLQETDSFKELKNTHHILKHPFKEIIKQNKLSFLSSIICSAYMCSASYLLLVYMSTYLHQQFNFTLSTALWLTSIAALIEAISTLLFGWISDYVGRWQTLFISSLLMAIAALLFMMKQGLSVSQLIMSLMALAMLLGAFDGPLTMYLPETFNTNVRYSATAISYNIGGAAIGGLAPFIISIILHYVHQPQLILGGYLGIFAILACVCVSTHAQLEKQVNRVNVVEKPAA
jgi:MHS family proline/betaine transporter-like MFS transporter